MVMGTDVFALVTEWKPMVDAFRATGNLDFVWRSSSILPYAATQPFWCGPALVTADTYYEMLRAEMPADLVAEVDPFVRMLYPGNRSGTDDLAIDAGHAPDPVVFYSMRPQTVRVTWEHAAAMSWEWLRLAGGHLRIGDRYVPDYDTFEAILDAQFGWLRHAARLDRGLIVVVSA